MDLEPPLAFEVGTVAVLVLIVAADLVLAYRRPRAPTLRESAIGTGLYIGLALAFAGVLYAISGAEYSAQFVTSWVAGYSLSIDNLVVFAIIMAALAVPRQVQQQVLLLGIVLALVLRGVLILVGAAVIEQFSAVFYLFGLFLLYTAVNQLLGSHGDEEEAEHRVIAFLRRRITVADRFDGARLRTVVDGRRVLTPVVIAVVALGTTDVVFALDSVPAIFGITQSPFLVFSANLFALMGLRQLYFLVGDLAGALVYLRYGVAVVLAFLGVKLVFHALHSNQLPFVNGGGNVGWAPEIGTLTTLAVIVAAMALAAVASVVPLRRRSRRSSKGPRHR
jgi:tellurite resistance protein TerC